MKSRVHFQSHPLHPILIAFPTAFFVGVLVFDILGYAFGYSGFTQTAYCLTIGGLAGGIVAAIPGLIDLLSVVPPHSSAKKRGVKHGLLNTLMLIIFGCCLWFRQEAITGPVILILLEAIGVLLLGISGFLGGTLVYRNQIGVDIRYASAGRWKEVESKVVEGTIILEKPDLEENQMQLLHAGGKRLVVSRTHGRFVVFDDHCPHRGGSLAAGSMMCGTVQCPWHGSQFDVLDGSLKAGPAIKDIKTYTLEEKDAQLYIYLA